MSIATFDSQGTVTFQPGSQRPTIRQGNVGDVLQLDAAGQLSWSATNTDAVNTAAISEIEADLTEKDTATALVQTHLDTTNSAVNKLKTAQFSGNDAAIADGTHVAGDFSFWLDDTNGAVVFHIKAKQADGTVVNGTVSLA
jgi:hypothetical protein